MTIHQNREEAKLTVAIEGRLDTMTAPELEKALEKIWSGVSEFVLDMTRLEYVSSAGLRVILKAQKIMSRQGKMKLVGVNESIMEVFEITGFTDILTIE
ncbi:MAG: STAS domain-containing protein [Clostridia bacterium]|nr:STAS domain-containing protein [Clostridia bacterium]